MKRTAFLSALGSAAFSGCAGGGSSSGGAAMTPATAGPSPSATRSPSPAPTAPVASPARVWGVTIDDVSNQSGLLASLGALPARPTARIVFDPGTSPADYAAAIAAFAPVSGIMGCICDSSAVKGTSLSAYTSKMQTFLAAFPNLDIWEIGNEVNGNWLGTTSDVVAKIDGAFAIAKNAGKKTALTLYYQPPQTVTPGYDMLTWASQNVPADMKAGLDYVLVSYYETDNANVRPNASAWATIFAGLQTLFPGAKLGFGEIGMDNPATGSTLAQAEGIMSYYYSLTPAVANWIGGYFWWYFAEDCVPTSSPLFGLLSTLV